KKGAPAAAVEWFPLTLRLRQPIGDRIDDRGMMTHPAMAAFDLDALRLCCDPFLAALPGANAIGAAEDSGSRHRRGRREGAAEARIFTVGGAAAGQLIDAPGVGRPWRTRERAAKRNHAAHTMGHHLGELARIEASEAPADERDLPAVQI